MHAYLVLSATLVGVRHKLPCHPPYPGLPQTARTCHQILCLGPDAGPIMLRRYHCEAVGRPITSSYYHLPRPHRLRPHRSSLHLKPPSHPYRLLRCDCPPVRLKNRRMRDGHGRTFGRGQHSQYSPSGTGPHVSLRYRRSLDGGPHSARVGLGSGRSVYEGHVKSPEDHHLARVQLGRESGSDRRLGPNGQGVRR